MPRFKSTGLSSFPSRCRSAKFCTLRAPTCKYVRMLGDELDVVRIEHLRDHRQAGFGARLCEELQTIDLHALEAVGRGARLVSAAAEHVRPGRLDRSGGLA